MANGSSSRCRLTTSGCSTPSASQWLLTNDTLGLDFAFDGSQPGIPAGQLVTYRGSQGLSDYYALAVKTRYRRFIAAMRRSWWASVFVSLASATCMISFFDW